jgi:hypothetical protein
MNGTFTVPADGPDLYRSFVVPIDLPEGKWVKAIELRPQARSLVHHALYFAVDSESAREKDARTPEAGFGGMASPIRERLGGYVPGVLPERLPEDLAQPLPAHTDLVIQTHFHPNGKEAVEQMTVGFYFTDKAPTRELAGVQLPPLFGRGAGIDIPAGEDHFVIQDSYTLPADATAYLVSGHAHYVCQQQELVATFPDGTKQTLLDIDDWDLNWQGQYRFEQPIKLPAGTRLDATLIYDNSSANPQNPHSPPQRIRWGEQSTDEMGSVTLSLVADHPEDASKLKRGYFQKLVASTGGGRGGAGGGILQAEIQKRLGGLTADTFGRLDANRDGVLQKTEIPER